MIHQCTDCSSTEIEIIDDVTGEILPDWLVDCREELFDWDTTCEPGLLAWQDKHDYSDEVMQWSVDGLINSERYEGPKPKGYNSPSKALMRRIRMGYDIPKPQGQTYNGNGRVKATSRY